MVTPVPGPRERTPSAVALQSVRGLTRRLLVLRGGGLVFGRCALVLRRCALVRRGRLRLGGGLRRGVVRGAARGLDVPLRVRRRPFGRLSAVRLLLLLELLLLGLGRGGLLLELHHLLGLFEQGDRG